MLNYITKEITLYASNILNGLLNATFKYISSFLIYPNII